MYSSFWIAIAALAVGTAYAQDGSEDGANNSTTPTAQDGNRTIHYVDAAKGGHFFKVRASVVLIHGNWMIADLARSQTASLQK